MWIDLNAEKDDGTAAVFIEIKDFQDETSIQALRDAVGQYVLYRAALKYAKLGEYPLYLAVPQSMYDEMLTTPVGQLVIEDVEMNILIFNPEKEVIEQWIPFRK